MSKVRCITNNSYSYFLENDQRTQMGGERCIKQMNKKNNI